MKDIGIQNCNCASISVNFIDAGAISGVVLQITFIAQRVPSALHLFVSAVIRLTRWPSTSNQQQTRLFRLVRV